MGEVRRHLPENIGPKPPLPPEYREESDDQEDQGTNKIQDALDSARVIQITAPRPETPAYERMINVARNYIGLVDAGVHNKEGVAVDSSGTLRRKYHDELSVMIFGRKRDELSEAQQDQVSDFAAYLMGADEYVGTWHKRYGKS